MSHVAERSLIMDATTWSSTPAGYGGDAVSAPVAIKVRWVDRNERFINPLNQTEEVSRAVVFCDRTLKVGDWLFLGTSTVAHPKDLAGAYKIRRFDKIPSLRNLLVVRKAYL